MRTICLYFQIHQPFRLKRYRFFNIGHDHYYYDDYSNESIIHKVAMKSYLPANKIMNSLIKKHKKNFKIAFSISGIALDQFELYAPEVLDSFRELADTGNVEFLAETNAHSLASLKNPREFRDQVDKHRKRIKELFGQEPKVFRNTELVYSDEIGKMVGDMGFRTLLTEGAKHVLGWKSPNYLYSNAINPDVRILLKNFKLSDDIAFRFSNKGWSEYPLTTEKFTDWLKKIDPREPTVNLFMDYETFGEHQWEETGIFEFLKHLPTTVLKNSDFVFRTPSGVAENLDPVSTIEVPYPISWADEERDLTAWLGNEMQDEAFNKLYSLTEKIRQIRDPEILKDWEYLQESDHFYYMCTKFFSDGDVHSYFNPYNSPYDAFINYMNVLSDFVIRVNAALPRTDKDKVIANLSSIIEERDMKVKKYEEELKRLEQLVTAKSKEPAPKTAVEKAKKPLSSSTKTGAKSSGTAQKSRSTKGRPAKSASTSNKRSTTRKTSKK